MSDAAHQQAKDDAQFLAVVMEASAEPNPLGGQIAAVVRELDRSFLLPSGLAAGDVLIDVSYSGLNYKEANIYSGRRAEALPLPLIMGIDAVGTVRESAHPAWGVGDAVIINGAGLGHLSNGGISELVVAPGDSLVGLPAGLTDRMAGAHGTAGFTAALSVDALVRHGVQPGDGPVLVTGASGGVGAIAVMLLARAGFEVAALTGRSAANGEMLRRLGATTIVERSELEGKQKPLQSERWAGVVDTVGGQILANALSQTSYDGIVTCCGLAASHEVTASMFPFILRGVTLVGINSVDCPVPKRVAAWERLAADTDNALLESITEEISMEDVPARVVDFLSGSVTGRLLVRVAR